MINRLLLKKEKISTTRNGFSIVIRSWVNRITLIPTVNYLHDGLKRDWTLLVYKYLAQPWKFCSKLLLGFFYFIYNRILSVKQQNVKFVHLSRDSCKNLTINPTRSINLRSQEKYMKENILLPLYVNFYKWFQRDEIINYSLIFIASHPSPRSVNYVILTTTLYIQYSVLRW